jgi:hypothetical protein
MIVLLTNSPAMPVDKKQARREIPGLLKQEKE